MAEKIKKQIKKHYRSTIAFALILVMLAVYVNISPVRAASIGNKSVKLSDSRPTQTGVAYDAKGDYSVTGVACLKIQFCTTATGSCTLPTSMVTTSATRNDASWSGWTAASWTINNTTNGTIKYTHATTQTGGSSYIFSTATITNPDAGVYFGRINTYTNSDCSTGGTDSGTVAFSVISGVAVSATVAETLSFAINAVAGSQAVNGATTTVATTGSPTWTVPLGELSSSANSIAAHDLVVSTNAQGGYTTTVKYTAALTSGTDTITDHTGTNAAPSSFPAAGTEAFGYTTNDAVLGTVAADRFTNPGNYWAKFTTSPLEVAYSNAPVSNQTTRVGYQAGISGTTKAGSYSTTVIYVTTPIF